MLTHDEAADAGIEHAGWCLPLLAEADPILNSEDLRPARSRVGMRQTAVPGSAAKRSNWPFPHPNAIRKPVLDQ